ncbi:putative membrane protein [Neorickettsia helminthoeca str. Oregon]|uniref:Putative membrane protein n=1 Tax=Neorickettsia helminthoeca str. Oregon TaxID=1286528 RepID=X5H4A7_9RICK|nr:putative membrane protein [Neorickettsia helminthoeca str. Oregon]
MCVAWVLSNVVVLLHFLFEAVFAPSIVLGDKKKEVISLLHW